MRRFFLAIPLVFGLVVPALAQETVIQEGFITGNEYRELLGTTRELYVVGWVDGVLVSPIFGAPDSTQSGAPVAILKRCISDMTSVQLEATFWKWLGKNPERWHQPAHTLMYAAMNEMCRFYD